MHTLYLSDRVFHIQSSVCGARVVMQPLLPDCGYMISPPGAQGSLERDYFMHYSSCCSVLGPVLTIACRLSVSYIFSKTLILLFTYKQTIIEHLLSIIPRFRQLTISRDPWLFRDKQILLSYISSSFINQLALRGNFTINP